MILFRTVSGRRLDLAHPQVAEINVYDIACGLSKICRFTGQLREFYSVAQHAIMVAELVEPQLYHAALHHDDSEAYLNDLSRHLKHSPHLAGYRQLEDHMSAVIETALGIYLSDVERSQIKAADDLVAVFERVVIRERQPWQPWSNITDALSEGFIGHHEAFTFSRARTLMAMAQRIPESWLPFVAWDPRHAEQSFLSCHERGRQ